MNWDETKTALVQRLSRYNAFSSDTAQARLYQAILTSYLKIRRKGEWWWKNGTAPLSTSAGVLGPYTPPPDFYRFALERRVYKYGYTDPDGVVLAPIRPSNSDNWDLMYRVEDGMLYFRKDPGNNTLTLNYLQSPGVAPTEANAQAAVEALPSSLFDVLAGFVEFEFLNDSPDTRNEGLEILRLADINLSQEWEDFDKGNNRQRQRSPRGLDGLPFDGLGQQQSIRKGTFGRYPRGRGYF